jgi:hypothetical protein
METTRRSPLRQFIRCIAVLGAVMLLFLLYAGAYFVMAENYGVHSTDHNGRIIIETGRLSYRCGPNIDPWLRGFFAPMHALDRRARPRYWSE